MNRFEVTQVMKGVNYFECYFFFKKKNVHEAKPKSPPVMPDSGTNPAKGLFFARFEYIRDSPAPRQSGITGLLAS